MELHEALRQISEIRQQMAQSEVFRGYRSLTVGFSGLLGLLAAALQAWWVPQPMTDLGRYLGWWMSVAAVSLLVNVGEMLWKARRAGPGLDRERTILAVEQFVPCLVIGALITWCIYLSAQSVAWMLPGLWSVIFSLGIFASYRLLPRPALWCGVYYAVCGGACLLWGQGENALNAWQMALCFGGGQLLGAVTLYWYLERPDAA